MSEELEKAFHDYISHVKFPVDQVPLEELIKKSILLAKESLKICMFWLVEDGRLPQQQADMMMSVLDFTQWMG